MTEAKSYPDIFNEPVKANPDKDMNLVGFHFRDPVKIFGRLWNIMDVDDKLDAMYGLQIFGGMSLVAGGAMAFAVGGPATLKVLAAGWATTGTLNSIRSIGQILARRKFAKTADTSYKTELGNSFVSALTNTPQAMSGSVPGVAAVLSYGIRCMRNALLVKYSSSNTEKEINLSDKVAKRKAFARISLNSDGMEEPSLFDTSHIKSNKFDFVGSLVNTTQKVASKATDFTAKGGQLAMKFKGGDKILSEGPGYVMKGRAVLQIAEGMVVGATFGKAIGAPLVAAGLAYVTAGFFMRSADSSHSVKMNNDELPEFATYENTDHNQKKRKLTDIKDKNSPHTP